jgi:membrane-associated protein
MHQIIDLFLHLDKHLAELISSYGMWTYAILFAIIFCETGLVVTPFLPGDSLLFAAGALAGTTATETGGGVLNPHYLFLLLAFAAIIGDTVNYHLGKILGDKIFKEKARFLKKDYLDRTHRFYEKHGGKTIILARFVPIVRTFAPFVAGVGKMTYAKFISYNIIGGIVWVAAFVYGGYFFGQHPLVKKNFTLVVIAIILISVAPMVYEYLKVRAEKKRTRITEAG